MSFNCKLKIVFQILQVLKSKSLVLKRDISVLNGMLLLEAFQTCKLLIGLLELQKSPTTLAGQL